MEDFDREAVRELFEMETEPICNTLRSLLGRKAAVTLHDVVKMPIGDLAQLLPGIGVVLEGSQSSGEEKAGMMYLFQKMDMMCLTNYIMGHPIDRESPLDEIALSVVKEVGVQCIRSAGEELGDFLGWGIKTEVTQAASYDGIGGILDRIRRWRQGEIVYLITFHLDIEGVCSAEGCGVISGHIGAVLGISGRPCRAEEEQPVRDDKIPVISVQEVDFPEFQYTPIDDAVTHIGEERKRLRDVTLDISVRIGGAVCSVKQILDMKPGQVVTLDKQAGSPADILVNGVVIGKGDIVVTDDRFAARISEILDKRD